MLLFDSPVGEVISLDNSCASVLYSRSPYSCDILLCSSFSLIGILYAAVFKSEIKEGVNLREQEEV